MTREEPNDERLLAESPYDSIAEAKQAHRANKYGCPYKKVGATGMCDCTIGGDAAPDCSPSRCRRYKEVKEDTG